MNREAFLVEFTDVLGSSVRLRPETKLADIPEWDSLTMMSAVTHLASTYGTMLTLAELKSCDTIADIIAKMEG